MRLRPLHRNHVWSFDFLQAQTHDGRTSRILTLIDEHSRACLALKVARPINSVGVIEAVADAICLNGIPQRIRCDNGPEMISKALPKWVAKSWLVDLVHRTGIAVGEPVLRERQRQTV